MLNMFMLSREDWIQPNTQDVIVLFQGISNFIWDMDNLKWVYDLGIIHIAQSMTSATSFFNHEIIHYCTHWYTHWHTQNFLGFFLTLLLGEDLSIRMCFPCQFMAVFWRRVFQQLFCLKTNIDFFLLCLMKPLLTYFWIKNILQWLMKQDIFCYLWMYILLGRCSIEIRLGMSIDHTAQIACNLLLNNNTYLAKDFQTFSKPFNLIWMHCSWTLWNLILQPDHS